MIDDEFPLHPYTSMLMPLLANRHWSTALLSALLLLPPTLVAEESRNLPELGDTASATLSPAEERRIGQQFLRAFRAQVPTVSDPLIKDYFEHLVYALAEHSALKDRRLEIIVVDSPQLQAFAVPGGIVGIYMGLFLNGETEHEISAILAHELAHLSQRHHARGADASRKGTVATMAGLLASLVLIATTGGDAGIAALMGGQALAQQNQLRYSRARESEADRIGIDTLADAGMDPRAMAYMFERLDRLNRLRGSQVPEFLLTHPVTRARITDSYNQTEKYPRKSWPYKLDYQLMRARARVLLERNTREAAGRMREEMRAATDPVLKEAASYGLAIALTRAGDVAEAKPIVARLRAKRPGKIAYLIAEANVLAESNRYDQATAILEDAIRLSPDNYPLSVRYAELLVQNRQAPLAESLLEEQSLRRSTDADIWYLLAETYGLSNNITGVHEARAEYFVLNGNLDQAIKQLQFAIPLVRDNFQQSARIEQRIIEIETMQATRL